MHTFRALAALGRPVTAAALGMCALFSLPAMAAQRECTYQVQSAQVYGTGTLEGGLQLPLLLDAYLPDACADGPAGIVPPIVLIPGGGFNWVQRDRPRIVEIADGLARAGFAVFAIEHRVREQQGLSPVSETLDTPEEVTAFKRRIRHSPYPGDQHFQALVAMEDGLKAVTWVRERAAVYGLDAANLGLLGGSSGACTVLGMAYSADEMQMKPLVGARAVVDMWGDFYPHTDLKAGNAPVLVLAGTEDPVIPYEQTTDLVKRARRVGVEASRITMPGVKHGLDDADIFHREIVGTDITVFEAIVQFLEARLRPQGGQVWPPTGQTREMTSETDPPPLP
jgi:acetyl esterase/lipase